MMRRLGWIALLGLVVSSAGCRRGDDRRRSRPKVAVPTEADPQPRVPAGGREFAPALSRVTARGPDGATLVGAVDECATCHADIAAQWRSSPHAASSFDNPIYRSSVVGFRETHGEVESRFCAGCHDPALLVDGAMDRPVSWRDDPRARLGVSCTVCHGIEEARVDGNGSWTLDGGPPVIPVAGDAPSLEAHRQRYRPLKGPELCASCHRSFLGIETGHPHHLSGIDDFGDWQKSGYSGSRIGRIDRVEARACRDCHMPAVEAPGGEVRSHRFAGGHTWLAAMRGDASQLAMQRTMLEGAVRVDVAALRRADGALVTPSATLAPGERWTFEVVIENVGVGHRFPGGTRDAHDTWVEVVVRDDEGEILATSAPPSGPDGHRLRSEVLDDEGRPVRGRFVERFRAPGYDLTVGPRDAQLVRWRWTVPEDAVPATVEARVMHRSRDETVRRRACAVTRPGDALDGCLEAPTTTVAEHILRLDDEAAPDGRRLLALLRGWTHALVEDLDAARPVADRALAAASGDPQLEAAIFLEAARIEARQGRIPAMDAALDQVEARSPGHPAIAMVRGRALASVFRNAEAATWFRLAVAASPGDPRASVGLAVALGSSGDARGAFRAATAALRLVPRHPDALRIQALALGEGEPLRDAVHEAFLRHRLVDEGATLRGRCATDVPGCGRERTPAHVHALLPPMSDEGLRE